MVSPGNLAKNGLACIRLTGEEGLMVLRREVHVVIGQRLLHATKDKKIKLNNKKQ
jgi:hypothetical protein